MTTPLTSSQPWYRRRRNILIGLGALVLAGAIAVAGGLWYVLIGPPGPSEASADIAAGISVPAPASFDGSWQVNDSLGSFSDFTSSWLGYRVQEQFAGVGGHTAVGRTPKATGSLTLKGATVTAASITGDLTALTSDAPQRDGELGDSAIESNKFPNATFVLTKPIDLGSLPSDGTSVSGSLPVIFSDYGFKGPSVVGFVTVNDHGAMEFHLLFTHA